MIVAAFQSHRGAGYLSGEYAGAFANVGSAIRLERAGGWLLRRPIPGSTRSDAMGCYPVFCCQDWAALDDDLVALEGEIVAVSLVTDPFGDFTPALLARCFPDRCFRFKEHYVVELSKAGRDGLGSHHDRNVRKALRKVDVDVCQPTEDTLERWVALYDVLVERHGIRGMAAFSSLSFGRQFKVPGLVILRAMCADVPVGMLLWYVHGDVGYYHLGAYNNVGYDARASYALFAYAIAHFKKRGLRYLSLGAGAGVDGTTRSGLSRFKEGWATGTRPVYLCGRIIDHPTYRRLVADTGRADVDYFPSYRAGEFA